MHIKKWREFIDFLPIHVNLLAVSKGQAVESIRSLLELGQVDFGESRLQEALPKIKELKDESNIRWHFIGKLQANKVRGVVRSFDLIHSVDSLALAERISRIAGEEKKYPEIMLQVKLRQDPNKGGVTPQDLLKIFAEISSLPHIKVIGLMTMAPQNFELTKRKDLFMECRDLANRLCLQDCSMGMSQDWEAALEAGSTWLRLGSVLFGTRSNCSELTRDINKG